MLHGEFEGNKKYYSGSLTAMASDSKIKDQLKLKLDRGIEAARTYVTQKWGTHSPPSRFKGPFDNANVPLSGWVMLPARRHWIQSGRVEGALHSPNRLQAANSQDESILTEFIESFRTAVTTEHSFSSAGNASSVEGVAFCATEDALCDCNGFVLFASAMSASDDNLYPASSLLKALAPGQNSIQKKASGSLICSTAEFGHDPEFGMMKQCLCAERIIPDVPMSGSASSSCDASKKASQCTMWRQTGECGTGAREPNNDLRCDRIVKAGASGFCECCGGINVPYTCEHSSFRCADICREKVSEKMPVKESGADAALAAIGEHCNVTTQCADGAWCDTAVTHRCMESCHSVHTPRFKVFWCGKEDSHGSTAVAADDTGNADDADNSTFCALEGDMCRCTGVALITTLVTDSSRQETHAQAISRNFFHKQVLPFQNGEIKCWPEAFPEDPEFGIPKYCRCIRDGVTFAPTVEPTPEPTTVAGTQPTLQCNPDT